MSYRDNTIDVVTLERLVELRNNWSDWQDECNEFETKFCEDMLSRYRTFGPAMCLSAKQRNTLTDIIDKLKG